MRNKLVEIYGAGILAFTVIVGFGTLLIKFLALVGEGFLHEDAFGAGAIVFPVQDRRSFWRLRPPRADSGSAMYAPHTAPSGLTGRTLE